MIALVLVLLVVVAVFAMYGVSIGGTMDALGQPPEVWARAGFRRRSWVWQGLGVFFLPVAIGYSGTYFLRVRPRLMAAARELGPARWGAPAELSAAPAASEPSGEPLTIRMPWSVALATACAPLIGAVVGVGLAGGLTDFDGDTSFLAGYALVAVVLAPLTRLFGVRLTADAVVLRGLRRRTVAWSEVEMVQSYSALGSQSVRLWTRGGRRYRLRAPCSVLGLGRARFDRDTAAIQRAFRSRTS